VGGFIPLVGQFYLAGVLSLDKATACDDPAVEAVGTGMAAMDAVTTGDDTLADEVPSTRWYRGLHRVMENTGTHPRLAGLACALLAARGQVTDEALEAAVVRRLSMGADPVEAAGFLEGLLGPYRDAVMSRHAVWQA
jgi:hypothetical protein